MAKQTGTAAAKAKEKINSGRGLRTNSGVRERATAGQDLATIEKRIHAKRCLRRYRGAEGAEHLHATGTTATMARIDAALKPIVDQIFKHARTEGIRDPLEAYLYDALVELADRPAGDQPAPQQRIRHLGVLRIDWEALIRGCTQPGETCEIAGLGPISVDAAREMLGESILKLVITHGVDVVNVTHLGRGPNLAQKIALLWQQPTCSRQGCNRRARLEYDDREEYRKVRCTTIGNTDPLCDPDDDLKTYQAWELVEGKGKRPMVPPDDPRHPKNGSPP